MTEHVRRRMAESQLAFTIVERKTRRVRIPGVWVLWNGKKMLCAYQTTPGVFRCAACRHGWLERGQKQCWYCKARVVKK